jgi:hypothetical protein
MESTTQTQASSMAGTQPVIREHIDHLQSYLARPCIAIWALQHFW